MNVLITGSEGFIGSHVLAKARKRDDWQAIGVDYRRVAHPYPTPGPDLRIDLTDYWAVHNLLKDRHIDLVINCAGEIREGGSWQDPVNHWRNNTLAAATLFDAARRTHTAVIHLSTAGLNEFNTMTPYLASKWSAEMAADLASSQGADIKYIRLHNPYGYRQPDDFIVPKFMQRVAAGEKITVGRNSRDYVHIDDVAWHLTHIAPDISLPYWELGTGQAHTDAEVAYTIMSILGKEVPVEFTDDERSTVRVAASQPYNQEFMTLQEGISLIWQTQNT